MTLLLDNIIFSLQKSGGVSKVWSELLHRILDDNQLDPNFLMYPNSNIFANKISISKKQIQPINSLLPLSIERYLQPSIKDFKGVFHSSYYRYIKNKHVFNITTVHDFTYEYFRKGLPKVIHSYQKSKAILNADHIICVSKHTKCDLLKFYPKISPSKITVVHNGVDTVFQISESKAFLKNHVPPRQCRHMTPNVERPLAHFG